MHVDIIDVFCSSIILACAIFRAPDTSVRQLACVLACLRACLCMSGWICLYISRRWPCIQSSSSHSPLGSLGSLSLEDMIKVADSKALRTKNQPSKSPQRVGFCRSIAHFRRPWISRFQASAVAINGGWNSRVASIIICVRLLFPHTSDET